MIPQWLLRTRVAISSTAGRAAHAICNAWVQIPIIGQIHLPRRADHAEAIREMLVSLLISTAPITVGAVVLFVQRFGAGNMSYAQCILSIVGNGELFIYASSTVAPVIYIVTKDRANVTGFPGKFSFIIFAIACTVLATAIFTTQRLAPGTIPLPMVKSSLWVFGISVLAFYLALVFNNSFLPNPSQVMRDSESHYLAQLRAHRS